MNQSLEGVDENPMTADEMKIHRKKMTNNDVGRKHEMIETFWAQDTPLSTYGYVSRRMGITH
jgi:hypothetical protein